MGKHKKNRPKPSGDMVPAAGSAAPGPSTPKALLASGDPSRIPERLKVQRLVGAGKAREAVDLARMLHRRGPSLDAEALVAEAYAARCLELLDQGKPQEAASLLALAQERYPSGRHLLERPLVAQSICGGNYDAVLGQLGDPQLDPKRLEFIEEAIERYVSDLTPLFTTTALPEDHPLVVQARALQQALEAVTAGPVDATVVELPEVPRRGPLAGWKALVRAMQAFHSGRNDECRRYLSLFKPGTPPSRLGPVLACLTGPDDGPSAGLSSAEKALFTAAAGDRRALDSTLTELERSINSKSVPKITVAARRAIGECKKSCPDGVTLVLRQIAFRLIIAQVDPIVIDLGPDVTIPMDSWVWSRAARWFESRRKIPEALISWEAWLAVSLNERQAPRIGLNVGPVWEREYRLLREQMRQQRSPRAWEELFLARARTMPVQRMLADVENGEALREFLARGWDGEIHIQRLCIVDPTSARFSEWIGWLKARLPEEEGTRVSERDQRVEAVARLWHEQLPNDIDPLLLLGNAYRKRSAYATALQYFIKAELIGAGDPRLEKSICELIYWRFRDHVKQGKYRLAWGDFGLFSERPSMKDEDGKLLVEAFRWCLLAAEGRRGAAADVQRELVRRIGDVGCAALLVSPLAPVAKPSGGFPPEGLPKPPRDPAQAVSAFVQCARCWDRVNLRYLLETPFGDAITRGVLGGKVQLTSDQARWIAAPCGPPDAEALLYAASGVGLRLGESPAYFLAARAHSLPLEAPNRTGQCLRIALALARANQEKLTLEAIDYVMRESENSFGHGSLDKVRTSLDIKQSEIDEVIRREIEASNYPDAVSDDFTDGIYGNTYECHCRHCTARRTGTLDASLSDWDDEDDDEDEDEDEEYGDDDLASAKETQRELEAVLGRTLGEGDVSRLESEIDRIMKRLLFDSGRVESPENWDGRGSGKPAKQGKKR